MRMNRFTRTIHCNTTSSVLPFTLSRNSTRNRNITTTKRIYCDRYFSSQGKQRSKFTVAIVGAGPSGFYTAKYLQSAFLHRDVGSPKPMNLEIDILERLPTPFGLVRYGVAPDHPEVKNVENDFTLLLCPTKKEKKPRTSIQFFGNVNIGTDISVQELLNVYDGVVLAYGCEGDRRLGVEGEDLEGILSAREFVAWYNGHPDYVHIGDQISPILSNPQKTKVVIIGQGNVALDCARILGKGAGETSALYHTDIASHALPVIQNGMKQITVLGRRGHVQGAFTIKELRELTKLKSEGYGVNFVVLEKELEMGRNAATLEELKGPTTVSRPKVRIDKLLRDVSTSSAKPLLPNEKQIALRFLLNPIQFLPNETDPARVGYVVCERTKLNGKSFHQKAVGTGELIKLEAAFVLVSIGYKGKPLPNMPTDAIFDETRGILQNENGKVLFTTEEVNNQLYVSGWLKRGPSGIIGTNIPDAKETVEMIMMDYFNSKNSRREPKMGRLDLLQILKDRDVQVVDWNGFEKIDKVEKSEDRCRSDLQPREKVTSVDEMLRIARDNID